MRWNQLYNYPKSLRSNVNGKRHYDVGDTKMPSVTTILSVTATDEKKESLARWRAKVGAAEADRITNAATIFHHTTFPKNIKIQQLLSK